MYYLSWDTQVELIISNGTCSDTAKKPIKAVNSGFTKPIVPNLSVSNDNPIFFDDFSSTGNCPVDLDIVLRDPTNDERQVNLSFSIEGDDLSLTTKAGASLPAINLDSDAPLSLDGNDLADFFELSNLDASGTLKDEFLSSNILPEGSYTISVQLTDVISGEPLVNSETGFSVEKFDAPAISSSFCDYILTTSSFDELKRFTVKWDEDERLSGTNIRTKVNLYAYEVDSLSLTVEEAIEADLIDTIFESLWGTNVDSLDYHFGFPDLVDHKRHFIIVEQRHPEYDGVFENDGVSEPCPFHFEYAIGGSIQVNKPADGKTFTKNEQQYFNWEMPSNIVIPNQKLIYHITIKEVEGDQTLEEAFDNNEDWYTYSTNSLTVNPGGWDYLLDKSTKTFSPDKTYVWELTATSRGYEIATSGLHYFNGREFLTEFYVGQYMVDVEEVYNYDMNNLSGIGKVVYNFDQDETEVYFNNIDLTGVAGIQYLNKGQVKGAIPEEGKISTFNFAESGRSLNFVADSIRLNKNQLIQLEGHYEYIIPNGISSSGPDTLKSDTGYCGYSNYELSGKLNFDQNFAVSDLSGLPSDYIMEFDDSSYFQLYTPTNDQSMFYGRIKNTEESISFPFTLSSSENLNYFALDNGGHLDLYNSDSIDIACSIHTGYADFSGDTSFTQSKEWTGIAFDSLNLVIESENLLEETYPLSWTAKEIDGMGIQLNGDASFNTNNKFKGYPMNELSIQIEVEDNVNQSDSLLLGNIDVPYISDDEDFKVLFGLKMESSVKKFQANQKTSNLMLTTQKF